MSNEWKMVPVEPTDDMIVAFAEAWYSKRQCIDDPDMLDAYRDMLAAAPVPPAGDVEVLASIWHGAPGDVGLLWSYIPAPAGFVRKIELVDRAHITRLTAEVDRWHDLCVERTTERDGLLAELAVRKAKHLRSCQLAIGKSQLAKHLQSELTKARELLDDACQMVIQNGRAANQAKSELAKSLELLNVSYQLLGLNNGLISYRQHMDDIYQFTNTHQSAPAAKGGESGEPLCLLCLDKKTVPGPKHGDFVRDCPECCGEEG